MRKPSSLQLQRGYLMEIPILLFIVCMTAAIVAGVVAIIIS